MSPEIRALGGSSRRRIGLVAATLMFVAAMLIPQEAAADLIRVGGGQGWTWNVNYTIWAEGTHFYKGDWLYFLYDRNQLDVLEVTRRDYDNCTSDHPLHNHTTGAGRDVVHLNETRMYYFISSRGYCFSGTKLAVNVTNAPANVTNAPPPSSAGAPGALIHCVFSGYVFVPPLITVGVLWLLRN